MEFLSCYYSQRLLQKLDQVSASPVTLLEAPSGYGKTTAIHKALQDKKLVAWFTASLDSSAVNYRRLCLAIATLDPSAGAALLTLGFPNRSNTPEIIPLFQHLYTQEEAYLVLDNFQLLQSDLELPLLCSFTQHCCPNLHVILITQYVGQMKSFFANASGIHQIVSQDLLLSPDEIMDFFRESHLDGEEEKKRAIAIHEKTLGWPVAISFLVHEAKEGRSHAVESDFDHLFFQLFWTKLLPKEQSLLLFLSLFDQLSPDQLSALWAEEKVDVEKMAFLKRIPLLSWDESSHVWYIHSLLSSFLKKQLDQSPQAQRQRVYTACGRFYREAPISQKALECFYAIQDYEEMLQCDLRFLEFFFLEGRPFHERIHEIFLKTSLSVKESYPEAFLLLAYYSFNAMDFSFFAHILETMREIIWSKENDQLKGEWFLTAAFYDFPYLEKMEKKYLEASRLMTRPSRVFTKEMPYMFGQPAMWNFFYTDPGQGAAIAETFTRVLARYSPLTGGQGQGADMLYAGELACMQGNYSQATIYAHQASYLGELHQQVTTTFGVALLLGRIAIGRSDMDGLEEAIAYLETRASQWPFMQGTDTNLTLLELVRSMLLSMLEEVSKTPSWIRKGQEYLARNTLATLQLAHVRINDLMLQGEYEKAIGQMLALESCSVCNTVTRYYLYTGIALSYLELGDPQKALPYLEKAILLAEEDSMISIFIHYRKHLAPLLQNKELLKNHGEFIRKILDQKEAFAKSDEEIFTNLAAGGDLPPTLTQREIEIASMAARGLHNKEIGARLHISQYTVKNHLQNIFLKLNVDRRSKLSVLLR